MVLQIALPFEDGAREAASATDRAGRDAHPVGGRPSGAATPAGGRRPSKSRARRHRRRGGAPGKRKWYSLYDKVFALRNLQQAWEKVMTNAGASGCDGQTVEQFEVNAEANLLALHEQLRAKTYRPRPVKRVEIPKAGGGTRSLGIPAVRDRIVQQAVLQVLEPIFEAKFRDCSHGFRPGRGCQTALSLVDEALAREAQWVADADIEKFFDTVDHELLLDLVNEEVADGSVLKLIRMFLESGVLMETGEVEPSELGTPQGGPLSPLLANIYLHPLDVAMQEGGFDFVRYADDFVILARSREQAEEALNVARGTLEGLKLRLHPDKTRIAAITAGFDFLGYRFLRDGKGRLQKVVSTKSRQRFRDEIRKRTRRHAGQKRPRAKRCTARRLKGNRRVQRMVAALNRYLVGWHGYFKGVRTSWPNYLGSFDGFARRRLRSAISGRYAKGRWSQILPNAVLAEIGLVSVSEMQAGLRQWPRHLSPNSGYPGVSRMR